MSVLMKWDGTMGEEQAGDAKTACDEPNSPEASSAYLGGYTIHTAHLPKLHLSLFRAETLGEANPGQVQRGWFLCDEHRWIPRRKQPPGERECLCLLTLPSCLLSWRREWPKRRGRPRWRRVLSQRSSVASPQTWWALCLRLVWRRAPWPGLRSLSLEVTFHLTQLTNNNTQTPWDRVLQCGRMIFSIKSQREQRWREKRKKGGREGKLRSSLHPRYFASQLTIYQNPKMPGPCLGNCTWCRLWPKRARLWHGGAEAATDNQEESKAICLNWEEGRQVLGVKNQEHNCCKKVKKLIFWDLVKNGWPPSKTGPARRGGWRKTRLLWGRLSWRKRMSVWGKMSRRQTLLLPGKRWRWDKALFWKCSFFKVAILREKMARFEAGIFSQPGNKWTKNSNKTSWHFHCKYSTDIIV